MNRNVFHRSWFFVLAIAAAVCARQTATGQNAHETSFTSIKLSNTEHAAHDNTITRNDKHLRKNLVVADRVVVDDPSTTTTTTTTTLRQNLRESNPSRSLQEVEVNLEERIISGEEAEFGQYPYFVRFGGCGGSLIAPRVVLTAAHCNPQNKVGKTVKVGAWNKNTLDNGSGNQPAQSMLVAEGIQHPDHFVGGYQQYDVGLMLLEEPYEMDSPIKLVVNNDGNFPSSGEVLEAIGMGITSWPNDGNPPDRLRYVDLPYQPNDYCQQWYPDFSDQKMCAGIIDDPRDTCIGDSGGPLLKRRTDGIHVQVGIVSYGIGCGNIPTVFSRVSSAFPWIQETICDEWQITDADEICNPDPPTPAPTCGDDPDFYHEVPEQDCEWAGEKRRKRCNLKTIKSPYKIKRWCKLSCKKCD